MKISVLVLLALVIISCSALKAKKISPNQQNRIAEMKKGNTWAGILMNLAELHMMAKGPLDDLVIAIQDVVADLAYKREKRDAAYVKRTNEHNELVAKLEQDIANAEADIENIEDLLVMLAEQKAALEEDNRRKLAENEAIRNDMSESTQIRAKQHEEFLVKVQETEEAVATVEECLQILNDFATSGTSFAQVKKAKDVISLAQKKLSKFHNTDSSILNALVQVATNQEFADHSAILKVVGKFNEIKNNLYNSIGALNADEAQQQSEFERFIADSKETIYDNEQTVAYNNELLAENAQNTIDNQALLAQRKQDKADFEQALDDENKSFEEATARYESWCAENDREVAVCNEALEVVSTVDFAGYIEDRINAEDGLVSSGMATAQQHGMGQEVFEFDYESPHF